MKLISKYLPAILALILFSGMQLQAQSKKEKEEEIKKLQQLEKELKMEEMERSQDLRRALEQTRVFESEELRAIIEDQKEIQEEALENYRVQLESLKGEKGSLWNYSYPDMRFKNWDVAEPMNLRNYVSWGSGESTSLNIHKELEDITFATKFKYEVQSGSKSFHFSASGSVEDGTILIKLVNPEGKSIHEFEVSPLADVEWSQNYKWSEEEAEKNFGTWTIIVSADEATGHYQVNVRAN